jgi:2-polyprenyl-6-methoxyphenol hydroxylase-like FAD-dependent oxidoreductase
MVDVLVVGSGPSGLMLACQLARHGVSFRIIDERADRAHESRAFGVQARTMEIFDQLGLADELLARAGRAEPVRAHADGKAIADLRFEDLLAKDTRFPALYLIPQPETEQVLLADLDARQVAIERELRLVSFRHDREEVIAVLEHVTSGHRETVHCQYLVGCDGAHSRVREGLNVPFEGATYPSEFVLADVAMPPPDAPLAFYLTRHAVVLVGGLGKVTRVMGMVIDDPSRSPDTPVTPVTIDEINAIARAARAPIQIERAEWMTRFRLHHRATRRYRVGRVFLAGDACHIHTPLGGQGMNTGFQDVSNLAWKLALVLRGGPVELLDTYELERQRVGEKLVHTTDRAFGFLTSRRFGMGTVRERLAPFVIRHVMGSSRLRARLVRFFSQLDIRYDANEFVRAISDGADHAFRTGLRAGCRVPDLDAGGFALHDLLRDTRVHVLAFGACEDDDLDVLERRHGARLTVHRIPVRERTREVFARFGVTTSAIYVIRPDGYVGFRSHGPRVAEAEDYLDELFGDAGMADARSALEAMSCRKPTLSRPSSSS